MSWIPAFPAARVLSLSALLAVGVASADDVSPPADNIVPIRVRQVHAGQFNILFVDVTVCNAAHDCRTVPNVQVDTGAVGLRLYREALDGLALDAVTDDAGRPLAQWTKFGTGHLWGTLHRAQVSLGKVATKEAIPIQLYDWPSRVERLPAGYHDDDARQALILMGNGILGISPRLLWTKRYYALRAPRGPGAKSKASDWKPAYVDETRQLANPIAHFPPPYDNGSVISLPDVDWRHGQGEVHGWLGLGIGAPTENLFPVGARRISHDLDKHDRFWVTLDERPFKVLTDSGCNVVLLDLDALGYARDPAGLGYYHADAPTPLKLSVSADANVFELSRPLYLGSVKNLRKAYLGYGVLPMLVACDDKPDKYNLLGLPFFYGRTVATGLRGAVNPYGPVAPVAAAPTSPHGFIAYTD